MSDSAAIDFRNNHNPPTTGEAQDRPCENDSATIEGGSGSASEGNAAQNVVDHHGVKQ